MPDEFSASLVVKQLSAEPAALGESPVWDAEHDCLWWIDGVAGRIHRIKWNYDVPDTPEIWSIGGHIGAIALSSDGHIVVARDHGFYLFDPVSGQTELLYELNDADPMMRLNDAKMDRQGRLICAGMGRNGDTIGTLHQIDAAARYRRLGGTLRIGNGVCFSPTGDILYFTDTLEKTLFICEYDGATGDVSPSRRHVDTGALGSGIDGATVDSEGNLWAAFIHTGEIACLAPDGRLLRRFPAPVDLPSSLAFGGPDMKTLFMTSIRDSGTGRAVSKHPEGGHLFAIEGTGATGLPEARLSKPGSHVI